MATFKFKDPVSGQWVAQNYPIDAEPISGSVRGVSSGGVYTALAGKSDTTHTHTASAVGAVPLDSSELKTADFLTRVSTNNYLAKIKKLSGKSVGVNQLVPEESGTYTFGGVSCTKTNGKFVASGTTTSSFEVIVAYCKLVANHIYAIVAPQTFENCYYEVHPYISYDRSGSIFTATSDSTEKPIYFRNRSSGVTISINGYVSVIDLTLIFGSGNEPSTVDNLKSAWLTKFGYPLPTYIPYNSGSIVDTDIEGIGSTGKNLWNPYVYEHESGFSIASDGAYTGTNNKFESIHFKFGSELIGQTVTLSAYLKKDSSTPSYLCLAASVNGRRSYSSTMGTVGEYGKRSLTVTPLSADDEYWVTYGSGGGTIYVKEPQLEVGSTATTFEPYSPFYRSFPIILRSAGNVKDTVEDCGSGYKVTRRVGVLTGSQFTNYATANGYKSYRYLSSLKNDGGVIANYGTYGNFSSASVTSELYFETSNGVYVSLLADRDINTLVVNYELATPITEYHSYNLTYPVTLNGTEYFDCDISVPCEIEYGVDALTDIVSGVVSGDTERDTNKYELLWENASPTSEFASQGIKLPMSKYKYFVIDIKERNTDVYYMSCTVPNMLGSNNSRIYTCGDKIKYRALTFYSDTLWIHEGRAQTAIGSTSQDNTYIIPYRIYGIK